MILSHACLPVPALPHEAEARSDIIPEKVNQFSEKLTKKLTSEMVSDFLKSRRQGLSTNTHLFYQRCLSKAIGIKLTSQGMNSFLGSLSCGNGKHAYYRALRALCNWLYKQGYLNDNPVKLVDSPHVATKLLPSITEEQVKLLLEAASCLRDRCIISLLFDSGLRLSEIASIKPSDIDWATQTIRVTIKGNREAKAAFASQTAILLRQYLAENGNNGSLFGLKRGRIQDMLSELSTQVGFPCNAHSFRRGFACNLHKKGLSTLTIMHLGRWSSLDMVARYCRSITFDDCLEHYRQVNS